MPRHAEDKRRNEPKDGRQRRAERYARHQGEHPHEPALERKYHRDVPRPHAEQCVEAKLPRAPPHQKDVGVAEQEDEDHVDKDRKGTEDLARLMEVEPLRLGKIEREQVIRRGEKRVEQTRREGERERVDGKIARGAANVADGKLEKHGTS